MVSESCHKLSRSWIKGLRGAYDESPTSAIGNGMRPSWVRLLSQSGQYYTIVESRDF